MKLTHAGEAVITERAFQEQVMELARLCGWRVACFRPAQTVKGWRTAVGADGAGYPDLTLVHPGKRRLIFWELKVKGKVTPEQEAWLQALNAAGIEARVIRPRDWDYIEEALK